MPKAAAGKSTWRGWATASAPAPGPSPWSSPNNPTGSFLKRRELEGIAELCQRHDLALIVDEVFSGFGSGADASRVQTAVGHDAALTFVLDGFSKMLGLPQMKLSWIHVSGPRALRDAACARLGFITDAYLSVGAPVMNAAPALLRGREALQAQYGNGWRIMRRRSGALRLRPQEPRCARVKAGGMRCFDCPRGWGTRRWRSICLQRDGVLVHPGFFYDFSSGAYLVLSLLPQPDHFREGTMRLFSCVSRMAAAQP